MKQLLSNILIIDPFRDDFFRKEFFRNIFMKSTKITQEAQERGIWAAVYAVGVYLLLNSTFKYGFSIVSPFGPFLATLISTLSVYPLFLRGTKKQWVKDEDWRFSTWLTVVVFLSVLVLLYVALIDWLFSVQI